MLVYDSMVRHGTLDS